MGFKTVVIECTVKQAEYPLGTTNELFKFELLDSNKMQLSFVETDAYGGSFPLVPDGTKYWARVTKNGVMLEQEFDIPATSVSLLVPDVLVIKF